jgi:hypothetical protein
MVAAADAREAAEAKRADAEREERAEAWRNTNLALYREAAEARGEEVTALELVGGGGGREINAVFADAIASSNRQDAAEAARAGREGAEPLTHVNFGEPVVHTAARSERGRWMASRYRHWRDAIDARRRADEAGARLADYGLVDGVMPRLRRDEQVEVIGPVTRSAPTAVLTADSEPAGGVSFR